MTSWLSRRGRAPARPRHPRLHLESLEDRTVPAGVPILHSLPGAPVAVYLDFDGGTRGSTTYTAYDIDGNPGDFNPTEVAQITELHRQIANYYSFFNVDVTTEFDSRPRVWHLSGNSVSGGFGYVGAFPSTRPEGFNQSSDVRTRQSGIAHEVGHVFGLSHQSDYDLLGTRVNEYSSGIDARHGPLMGVDYAGTIHKFVIGRATSVSSLQDDIARIAQQMRDRAGVAAGNEFRPDDYGNTFAAAAALSVGQTATGIIERLTDLDTFSFTTTGPFRLSALRVDPSGVDLRLQVYTSAGVLVAEVDPANSNDATVTLQAAGSYYAVVSSHGDYGDLGVYTLGLATATAVSPPTYNALPVPTGLTPGLGAGTAVTLSWNAVAGATGYTVSRSADGVTYTVLTPSGIAATTFTDTGVSASQRWFYRVQARDGSTNSPPATADIVNRPAAPFNVTLTRINSGTTAVLNWRDVAGDNGYRVQRSTDGVTWTQVGTVGRNVPGFTNNGLTAATRYLYRVVATSPQGDSIASDVVATDNAQGLTATPVTGTRVDLRWSPVIGSQRYRVERTTDGVTYTALATVTGLTYSDTTAAAGTSYTYRVLAETTGGTARSPWSYVGGATAGGNRAPVLAAIADRTVPSTQDVVTVPLSATDPDGDPVTFSATAQSLAYVLDQQRGLFSDGNLYENFGGRGEKWVQGSGGTWYFITPNGDLHLWDGATGANGTVVGTPGASYHANPALLYNATPNPRAAVSVSGGTLTVNREDGFVGAVVVTVTASDGRGGTDTRTFTVTVTSGGNRAPVLTQPAGVSVPSSQLTVAVPLSATDPDGDPVTFTATAQSLAYVLSQQYGPFAYAGQFDNFGGRGEKWFTAPGGQWVFLLAGGELYLWDGGTGATGTLLGNVGASYHADPARLQNPPADQPRATLSVSGGTLTVTRDPAWVSGIVVTVTASDGRGGTDSRTFTVTVTSGAAQAPQADPGPGGDGAPPPAASDDDEPWVLPGDEESCCPCGCGSGRPEPGHVL